MSAVMEYKSPQIKKLRQFCVERLTQEQVFTVLDRLESLVFDLDNPNANPLLFGEPLIDRSSSQSEDAALESVKQEVLSLVEDLSDDADLSVSQRPEEFLSIDEVSQMYHVSTKPSAAGENRGCRPVEFCLENASESLSAERLWNDSPRKPGSRNIRAFSRLSPCPNRSETKSFVAPEKPPPEARL